MQHDSNELDELIAVDDVKRAVAWWPYSSHGTYRLIRSGRLGAVAVGRRRFITRQLLAAFIAMHTANGHAPCAADGDCAA